MRFDSLVTRACSEAIAVIDARVVDAFLNVGGAIDDLDRRPASFTVAERAYRVLLRMGSRAEYAGDWNRVDAIRRTLDMIDQLAYQVVEELAAPRFEPYGMVPGWTRGYPLDPRIDAQSLGRWIQIQIDYAKRKLELEDVLPPCAGGIGRTREIENVEQEHAFFARAWETLERGFDPRIDSFNWIHHRSESGHADLAALWAPLHGRLLDAVGVEPPSTFATSHRPGRRMRTRPSVHSSQADSPGGSMPPGSSRRPARSNNSSSSRSSSRACSPRGRSTRCSNATRRRERGSITRPTSRIFTR